MKQEGILYKTLTVIRIREETEGFKTFTFEDGHGISYQSGQYLTFVAFLNGEEMRRSYSITSSPYLNESLSIGVKRVANGFFSRFFVDDLRPGDQLLTIGAGGFFTLPSAATDFRQVFFFAAGSGITPVLSLVKTLLYAYPLVAVVLIYSNASLAKTVFYPELIQLRELFAERFHIEFLFSNAADLRQARLHRDLLLSFLESYAVARPTELLFYICGPQNYMRMCMYTLQEKGIEKQRIRKEHFVIDPVKPSGLGPPDKAKHRVSLHMGGKEYQFEVQYPASILKGAKASGISLPYSCEAGRCGNCVARCLQGSVWHSYNEVLTEKEEKQGLILTCVGHPVGGDVVLEIGS